MKILITAGPTREYIDSVRFISNASSGRMGTSVAQAAVNAGWDVVLLVADSLVGAVGAQLADKVKIETFTSVDNLKNAVHKHFGWCDVLVMTAAVGDFKVVEQSQTKLSRKLGEITIKLQATEDILGSLGGIKRADQKIVAFAVEDGPDEQIEAKAREELKQKAGDMVVVNTPQAMSATDSRACILAADKTLLQWATRDKKELAEEIVKILNDK